MNKLFSYIRENNRKIFYIFGIKMSFADNNSSNDFLLIKDDGTVVKYPKIRGGGLKVRFLGTGARVEIRNGVTCKNCEITIGSNSTVILEESHYLNNLKLKLCGSNNSVQIGKNFSCESFDVFMDNNCKLTIGDNCMCSCRVKAQCSDGHAIYDNETKEVLNSQSDLKIGSHVWLGMDAVLLKNAEIPDDCIIGACTVAAKKFNEKNCIIAGNPARVIKNNINWSHSSVSDYIANQCQSAHAECR